MVAGAPTIAVIGGGIGGAAVTLALRQRGLLATLYEKDASFAERAQGYGLTMQQGANALRHLGLPNTGVFSLSHSSFLPDGTLIGSYGRAVHERTRDTLGNGRGDNQRRNAHIPRQALRQALLDELPAEAVRWDQRLERLELVSSRGPAAAEGEPDGTDGADGAAAAAGGGVRLRFSTGRDVVVQLVIGADGIWSTVRQQLLGAAACPLRYLGVVVVLGRAPCEHPLASQRVFQTVDGAGTRIYAMPFTEEPPVVMWQLSFVVLDEAEACRLPRDGPSLKAEALRRVGHWHDPLGQLLRDTNPDDITGYPAYDREVPEALRRPALCEAVEGGGGSSGGGGGDDGGNDGGDGGGSSSSGGDSCGRRFGGAGGAGDGSGSGGLGARAEEGGEGGGLGAPWHAPRAACCTLLGDAAHPMSPFKGQGANQALLDAIDLARAVRRSTLAGGGVPLSEALDAFERQMLRRAAPKVGASREAAMALHAPSATSAGDCTRMRAAAGATDAETERSAAAED